MVPVLKRILRRLGGRVGRQIVYAADTRAVPPPDIGSGLTFRALDADDLGAITTTDPSLRDRQLAIVRRVGACYAFGVFSDGDLTHVSWLLPPAAIARDLAVIRARPDEAEISFCETLPAFRGRGIYSLAIRCVVEVARGRGVRRVFMKTLLDNTASQRGITNAGLSPVGTATLIVLPMVKRLIVLRAFR